MKKLFYTAIVLLAFVGYSQTPVSETEIAVSPLLSGTLFTSARMTPKTPLVIMIAGSGPTDRYGNQPTLKTDSTKRLAEGLVQNNIAVFSYDKRIIAQIKKGEMDESKLVFRDFIDDANTVIAHFKSQKKYPKIIVAGHSEGSLIGMVAAAESKADGFISLAGAGQTIDLIVTQQITKQYPTLQPELDAAFAQLKKGETFVPQNGLLAGLFRESVQPYMISWIKFDPSQEIKKVKAPTLIVNGTKDLQVKVADAELLKQAKPDAKLEIIPEMNHVFREIKGDDTENAASYNKPELPIMPQLVTALTQFIQGI